MNVAVIGAGGAIGRSLAILIQNTVGATGYFFARHSTAQQPDVPLIVCDICSEASITCALGGIPSDIQFDQIWLTTGFLHSLDQGPEKSLRDISTDFMMQTFQVNTVGPALVMKHFLKRLKRKGDAKFLALSARVGSISDNHLGGWYSYRASKAALNMLLKTASIEMRRINPQSVIAGLHPGTVDSALSKPFQKAVRGGQLFTPDFAAEKLWQVAQGLSSEDSGQIVDWAGKKIPF